MKKVHKKGGQEYITVSGTGKLLIRVCEIPIFAVNYFF